MKKIIALLTASVITAAMTFPAFAATPTISGMTQSISLGYSDSPGDDTVDLGEVRPNDELEVYVNLLTDLFTWDDFDETVTSGARLSASQIRRGDIGVRTSVSSGSKAIENVSIDSRNGRIKIEFVDEYVSTKDLDFEFTVYLTIDGKRQTDYGMTFYGTLANEVVDVYEDDDYVDLSNGAIAEAQDYVREIEVDLGNGVSIFTKFFKGKKYYGTASRDSDEADDVVFAQYPDVDHVVTLKTVGLNSTGDIVRLDTDYSDYYVYDVNMNYLGQSGDLLPYSTKYYLANRQLNITDTVEEEVGDDSAPVAEDTGSGSVNPETGGDYLTTV